jgi:hypothetical protein
LREAKRDVNFDLDEQSIDPNQRARENSRKHDLLLAKERRKSKESYPSNQLSAVSIQIKSYRSRWILIVAGRIPLRTLSLVDGKLDGKEHAPFTPTATNSCSSIYGFLNRLVLTADPFADAIVFLPFAFVSQLCLVGHVRLSSKRTATPLSHCHKMTSSTHFPCPALCR